MPTTENPETVKLLEQGLCPGWNYYGAATRQYPDGNYETEALDHGAARRGQFRERRCRFKARAGSDLCGTHDNARKEAQRLAAQRRGEELAELARQRKVSLATNLATMLSGCAPVTFSVSDDGLVTLDLESARLLLDFFS